MQPARCWPGLEPRAFCYELPCDGRCCTGKLPRFSLPKQFVNTKGFQRRKGNICISRAAGARYGPGLYRLHLGPKVHSFLGALPRSPSSKLSSLADVRVREMRNCRRCWTSGLAKCECRSWISGLTIVSLCLGSALAEFWRVVSVSQEPWSRIWVVVKMMVPFWIPSIIRHLIFRVPQNGSTF